MPRPGRFIRGKDPVLTVQFRNNHKNLSIGSVIKQDGHCSYKVTLKRVRVAIVAVEKQ
jgi:hypothetical protein